MEESKYVSPKLISLSEFEMNEINGGTGVFVLAVGVTVGVVVFVASVAIGFNEVIGYNAYYSG